MKTLILLRGLPGSGKSTLAKSLTSFNVPYFEADMYFLREDGEYKFDASKLKHAHEWCRTEVEKCMGSVYVFDTIVVSNTFTQEWEMKPYYELAEKYGYTVFTLIVENRHGGINTRNVPTDKLILMKERFEIKL
jgi:predicted kinase